MDLDLARLVLTAVDDLTGLRQVAGRAARLLGLDPSDATRVATSASELGRYVLPMQPVTVRLAAAGPRADGATTLTVSFAATGPLDSIDANGGHRVPSSVARLVDEIELGASTVTITKLLPHPLDTAQLERIRDALMTERPGDLLAALQGQDEELIAAFTMLREREGELVRVHAELDQTNRGVVALYAELEQRAAEVRAAQRVVFEELESALRPPPPEVAGLEFEVRYVPAQPNSPTGGDLYDWFALPDGSVNVTVVDVAGHGVTSTRDALRVTHAVRTLVLEGHLIGQVLARADRILQTLHSGVVATVLLARIDSASGILRLAGAGHPQALLVPADGPPAYVGAPGRPLGYVDAGSRQVSTVQLAPGDAVLLYTDGLVEVRHDLVEGLETLRTAAVMAAGVRLPQLVDTTLAACRRGDQFGDDALLLGARWTPR